MASKKTKHHAPHYDPVFAEDEACCGERRRIKDPETGETEQRALIAGEDVASKHINCGSCRIKLEAKGQWLNQLRCRGYTVQRRRPPAKKKTRRDQLPLPGQMCIDGDEYVGNRKYASELA